MFRKLLICAALVAGSATANAGPLILDEGFDDLNLPDWFFVNVADSTSTNNWFQGNSGVFSAAAGAADSYIASDFLAAGASNPSHVDLWLFTPLMHADSGVIDLWFSTRTAGNLPGDSLEILVNNTGVLDLNNWVSLATISVSGYPTDWTTFAVQYDGAVADVRFAFRYLVADAANGGDYIGIDTVRASVPEPGTLALLAMGMLLAPLVLRRRREQV